MACGFPIVVHDRLRPCGKCQGCLRGRRRAWVARMLLEARQHPVTSFVTLTYADEPPAPPRRGTPLPDWLDRPGVPMVGNEEFDIWIPTLVKSHARNLLKALGMKWKRLGLSGKPPRYFLTGEYGSKSGRPHYHAVLFGFDPTWKSTLEQLWRRGFVSAYPANARTMAYVAKYCLKHSDWPEEQLRDAKNFRPGQEEEFYSEPPFRLMSQRPALGTTSKKNIVKALSEVGVENLAPQDGLTSIRIDGDRYPLDRTMRNYLEDEFHETYNAPIEVARAVFKRDDYEPTEEEIAKARQQHIKAQFLKGSRRKL